MLHYLTLEESCIEYMALQKHLSKENVSNYELWWTKTSEGKEQVLQLNTASIHFNWTENPEHNCNSFPASDDHDVVTKMDKVLWFSQYPDNTTTHILWDFQHDPFHNEQQAINTSQWQLLINTKLLVSTHPHALPLCGGSYPYHY